MLVLLLALAGALGSGCRSDPVGDALARLKEHEHVVCGCNDGLCARTSFEEYQRWADRTWPTLEREQPTAGEWELLNAYAMTISYCRTQLDL